MSKLTEHHAWHIQNLMESEPDAQVIELHVAEALQDRVDKLEKALKSTCDETMTVAGHPDFAFDSQINSMYEVALEALKVLKS